MNNPLSPREREEAAREIQGDNSTYHGRANMNDTEAWGGRFQGTNKPLNPAVDGYPRLPASHQLWAGDPPEPPLDATDCGNTFDGTLTRGAPDFDNMAGARPSEDHTQAQSLTAPLAEGPEAAPGTAVDAPPVQPIMKRRRLSDGN